MKWRRRPSSDPYGDDDEILLLMDVGHATLVFHDRHVTDEDRKRWRDEDEARDRRRIPLGFRAQP